MYSQIKYIVEKEAVSFKIRRCIYEGGKYHGAVFSGLQALDGDSIYTR